MFAKRKIEKLFKNKSTEEAIIKTDQILSSIFYAKPKKLSEEEITVVHVLRFEAEINNGGFSQFFYNTTGNYAEETAAALQAIGSTKFLGLLKSAMQPFPNAYVPKDRDERQDLLEEIEDEADPVWDRLDGEFYKYEENTNQLIKNYIMTNIENFR